MRVQLIRCVKAFCPDFAPVRQILAQLGAKRAGKIEQIDYFFRLRPRPGRSTRPRLKLRIENRRSQWIHYYERSFDSSMRVSFQEYRIWVPGVRHLLSAALGIDVIVHKERETWRIGPASFNLDHVHDVGQIFEVTIDVRDGAPRMHETQLYRRLFQKVLGASIDGSNEDLVRA